MIASATRAGLHAARFVGIRQVPGSPIPLPAPAASLPRSWPVAEPDAPTLIYFPTCLARMFGGDDVPAAFAKLCRAAGVGLVVPPAANGLCCGQPFSSKGFPGAADSAAKRTANALINAQSGSTTLVVTDTSTCASQLDHIDALLNEAQRARWQSLTRLHPAQAVTTVLMPRLIARGALVPGDVALVAHPTCSEHRHGWVGDMRAAALGVTTAAVTVPTAAGCCGMAGDKGWATPALTIGATAREGGEAAHCGATAGVTTSATCAMAMSVASGLPYRHLFALLAERLVRH